jgi:GrpB-like predicted nucleotidyltransferase (UPF0157 family)
MDELIKIVPYDDRWPVVYEEQASGICNALGNSCVAIHHIGSTAVPGLSAKPKIDILAVVDDFSAIDVARLKACGFDYRGEVINTGRYFVKRDPHIHLHLFEKNNPLIVRNLLFRDWLTGHEDDRVVYEQLKKKLSTEYTDGMDYCRAKTECINKIVLKALQQQLFDFLNKHAIEYQLFKHQPVFTVEDRPVLEGYDVDELPGAQSKNLFLKAGKRGPFFLVSVLEHKKVDLKALSRVLNCDRFSFGRAEDLLSYLQLTPGSVTPFGLMFDTQRCVTFVLDEDFLKADCVVFHPLSNDMSIALTPDNFLRCMNFMGHDVRVICIPER